MLDLYQADIAENLAKLKPVDDVEPGAFTNFFRGTGLSAMKGFAEVSRAASMAGAVVPIALDKIGGTGTLLTEKYFKEHDQVFNSAVDYWTPKPNEVGVAGEVTGKLLSMLPIIIANPTAAVVTTQLAVAEDLARKHPDVTATEANLVGGAQAAGLGLGIWMPILGQNLWQRVLLGGAGFNVAQGVSTRAISAAILGDKKAAKEFEAFDGTALTLDVLLGMAFGAIAHVVPSQRQQGKEAWERINQWAKGLRPSEIDALLVLREAQHINEDSLPGKPVTEQDVSVHVERIRTAIDQVARDQPVEVQDIKVSRGTLDGEIAAVSAARVELEAGGAGPAYRGIIDALNDSSNPRRPDLIRALWPEITEQSRAPVNPFEQDIWIEANRAGEVGLARLNIPSVSERVRNFSPDAIGAVSERAPQFEVTPAQLADATARVKVLEESAAAVRASEGLPRAEQQTVVPPRDITPLDPLQQAEAVGAHIERQLLQTGMQREEAGANAAIWSAFAKSAYERYGIPPSELMAKYGVDVKRMNSADMLLGALEQARRTQVDTPEFRNWFGDSKVVDAHGKPLVVYHGTFDDFDSFRRRTGDIGMHFGTSAAASDRVDYLVPHRKNKMGDRASANVMPVFLSLKNPLRLRDHGFWNADNMKGELLKLFPGDAERIGPEFGNRGLKSTKDIREFIQSKGYDGIVYRNTGEVAGAAPFREAERLAREAMNAVFPKGKNAFDQADQQVPEYISWKQALDASTAHREASTDDSYIAFERSQIKSAIGNRGTFDPNNPNILMQGGTKAIDRFTPEEWKAIDAEYLAATTRRERQRIINKAAGIKPVAANIERDGAHSPADAESGAAAWDLSGNGIYPEDVYGSEGFRYYANGDDRLDRQAYNVVMELEGKPNAPVKIYRAVDETTGQGIIAGDWVTTVRAYAKDHGDSALGGKYKIVSKTVTAKDIYTSGDSWLEWGYNPQPTYPRSIRSNDNGQLLPSERAAIASRDGLDNSKVLFQSTTEPFYSELSRQVDYLKMESAPAKGWKDTLKGLASKGVVKPAEIEATGLNDWLDIQEGKVTKQQVQDFIAQNGVRVEEVVLGRDNVAELRKQYESLPDDELRSEWMASQMLTTAPAQTREVMITDLVGAGAEYYSGNRSDLEKMGSPKFAQWQLPGGENYRELLLTLPGKENAGAERRMNELAVRLEGYEAELSDARHNGDVAATDRARTNIANTRTQMRLVEKESNTGSFRSTHFDQPNILAHIRFNERTDADGKKVLFLEEIQSDWAQKGKREGFGGKERWQVEYFNGDVEFFATKELAEKNATEKDGTITRSVSPGIPEAPFVGKTDAWVALSLKRMIRYAAENGFDRVAWTNGEQQVTRYTQSLRKQVDAIEWTKTKDGVQLVGYKGAGERPIIENWINLPDARMQGFAQYIDSHGASRGRPPGNIIAEWRDDQGMSDAEVTAFYNREARKVGAVPKTKVVDTTEKEDVLSDAIGKAMADKIKNDPAQSGVIEGADIRIDSTGMATFYDRIVPKVANEVLKKLGGERVGTVDFGEANRVEPGWTYQRNEDGLWDVMQPGGDVVEVVNTEIDARNSVAEFARGNTVAIGGSDNSGQQPPAKQSGFDITPALRDRALAGLPLFQTGARGAVNFDTGRTLISLFEKADKSTFQHETAHTFLEMTKDLASRDGVPLRAVQDWATLADWLKIEGGSISREAHEQFARGWEKYLAEGVAPNEGLKAAFKRFRDWLIDIYKSITNIDAKLSNQVRGVMARMLDSQARDPIEKGGLDDPRLQTKEYRDALEVMGREAGWDQIGGSIIRERTGYEAEGAPNEGAVVGRTEWIPRAEWYARMQASAANMPGVGGQSVGRAVRKALMGEKMSAAEKRAVTFMLDEHVKVIKEWDEAHAAEINPEADPFEFSNAMHAEGIEPTRDNLIDMVAIDRARELDPVAFENIPIHYDDHQYMVAIGEIIDAKRKTETTDQGRGADAQEAQGAGQDQTESVAPQVPAGSTGFPPPPGGSGEAPGAAAPPNAVATEARRIALENPDMKIRTGTEANGDPIYKTLNEMLDEAEGEAALAREDINLITVAAECLLGVA